MFGYTRYRGQAVEIRGRDGRVYRGVVDGFNQRRGLFLRSGFRRRFIPFFFIVAIFPIRRRRRFF